MPEGWEERFWEDIIKYNKGIVKDDYIELHYGNHIVAGKLAITSPFLLSRFNKANSTKDLKHRTRPFTFVTVGVGFQVDDTTKQPIIPLLPYTTNMDKIKYRAFIDYKTGKLYAKDTERYWKSMSKVFFDYILHKEMKFEGNIGLLKQRHINIVDFEICGKESNNLEESEITGVQEGDCIYYSKDFEQKVIKKIETLTLEEAKCIGMKRWQYSYLKRCVKQSKVPKLKKKTLRMLGLV